MTPLLLAGWALVALTFSSAPAAPETANEIITLRVHGMMKSRSGAT